MNAPRAIPTIPMTELPPGRRTAKAALEVDVLVAPALLPVESEGMLAPVPATADERVGAAYETE
jgi:hypothetical protein